MKSVIIGPERFVQQNFGPADFLPSLSRSVARLRARRHVYKDARICLACLYGKHDICVSANCSCIHREIFPALVTK
jgi:hypothetical protein